jgi:molybdopterin-containing oxidoreductase family membrane subunit
LVLSGSTLLSGLLLVTVDVGRMERFWFTYVFFQPSSILGWMIWAYSAFILTLGAMMYAHFRGKRHWMKPLALLGSFLIVVFAGGEGALFGVVGAKSYWNTGLRPLEFLFGAFLGGAGTVAFVNAIFSPWRHSPGNAEATRVLRLIILGLLVLNGVVLFADYSVSLYAALPTELRAFELVLFGPYSWVFWAVQLVLGILVPITLLSLPAARSHAGLVALAGLLVSIGLIGAKLNLVVPGLAVQELEALPQAFVDARLSTFYFPSTAEWLVGIGAFGLATFLFLAGLRVFVMGRAVR